MHLREDSLKEKAYISNMLMYALKRRKRTMYMFKNLDELMSIIVDSQDIVIDDRLSLLIERYRDDELTEENLDFISAASMPNYNKFLEKYIDE